MNHTTYSFEDLGGAIYHPLMAPYQFTGEGVGSIEIRMTNDRTAHDLAADGSIMVSKLPGNNGQISVNCQQTSALHRWLLKLYNTLVSQSADNWAIITIAMMNVTDGTSHMATGVSFGKKADKSYQAQGQRVTWTLWAIDISEENFR